MKATPGRLRVLRALAREGSFARPNRTIPGELHGMDASMEELFRRAQFIAEAPAPKRERLGYVWKITDKGRDWLAQQESA